MRLPRPEEEPPLASADERRETAQLDRARVERTPEALRDFVLADPLCRRLAAIADEHGQPIALVGGWVRDWLLGRSAPDWDLVVPGDPRPLARALVQDAGGGPLVPLDETFGIYRTRLRNGLSLDFAQAVGDTIETDLARRDLSINALAVRLQDGAVLDPVGGLADLAAGVIRTPSRVNLEDDPLRLVRIYRFAATLGFAVDPATATAAGELAPWLARSAGERVSAELGKLLKTGRAADALAEMNQIGLLSQALGAPAQGPRSMDEGPTNVRLIEAFLADAALGPPWSRLATWLAIEAGGERTRLATLQLAALLRDPQAPSVEMAAARLRWSRKEDDLIRAWTVPRSLTDAAASPLATHRFLKAAGEAVPGFALLERHHDEGAAAAVLAAYWRRLDAPLARLVDGHVLMRELGLPPGRQIAALLAGIEEAQALGELTSREEALAWAARKGSEGV